MSKVKTLRQAQGILKRAVSIFVCLTTVLWSIGLSFLVSIPKAEAAVTINIQPTELITSGQTAKASSADIAIAKFAFSTTTQEYLSSVTVTIATTTNSGMVATDLATLKVWKDLNGNEQFGAGDEVATSTTVINLGSATTLSNILQTATSSIGTATTTFFVTISTAASWSDNDAGADDAISVSVPANTIATSMGGTLTHSGFTGVNSLLADTTVPTVTTAQSGPPNSATGVPIDVMPHVTFSETMLASTLNTTNILLQAGGTGPNLCSSLTLQANGFDCIHTNPLATSTSYTLTVTQNVTDPAANGLALAYTPTFTTGSMSWENNITPPMVIDMFPNPGATGIPTNAKMKIYFSTDMATTTAGSATSTANIQLYTEQYGQPTGSNLLTSNANLSWNSSREELTVTPPSALTATTSYLLIVKNTIQSSQGINLPGPDFMIFFQTGSGPDNTGPGVSAIYPANGATNISNNLSDIAISFNEGIDQSTVSTTTIQLIYDANGNHSPDDTPFATSSVSYDPGGRTAHLSANVLLGNTATTTAKYFVVIKSGANGIKDVIGNQMAADVTKNFVVSPLASYTDTTQPYVLFANADNFELAITFSEPLKADEGTNAANNIANYVLESPVGTTINLTGKPISYEVYENTVVIENLGLTAGNAFRITASTTIQDLSNNALDSTGTPAKNIAQGTVLNANNTGGQLGPGSAAGPTDFFAMGVNPIGVRPRSPLAGATSTYEVEFPASVVIPAGGKILLTFPAGFNMTNATTVPASLSFENQDINGPAAGTVAINETVGGGDATANTVAVFTQTAATQANDMIRFELQGIVNSSIPKDFSTSGYTVDIKTFNTSGVLLESKVSMPFFLSTPGDYLVSGYVYNDADGNGAKGGGESGVASIKICLGGPMVGFNCQNTDSNGAYSFTQLSNGPVNIIIPPLFSGDYVGGPFFRDLMISGANQTNVNFALRATSQHIDVSITGGPANTKLDVFAFNPMSTNQGGNVIRETTLNAQGATAAAVPLPVNDGTWQVGVGPWMPKDPSMGPPPPPNFTFMPPKPQEVVVSGNNPTLSIALQVTNRTIIGKVTDGAGNGIANVFVLARPATAFTALGAQVEVNGGVAISKSDGTFTLNVINGVYLVDAAMPGMPPSSPEEVTVKDNTGASDNNSEADVYSKGTLLTGVGLTLKIAKGDRSIAGQVLDESGNPIAYAHVSGERIDNSGNPMGNWTDAPTDSSGRYTLYVSDGIWKVRAFAPNYGEITSITVTVSGASVSGKNLQPTTADFGTVSGNVKVGGVNQSGAFVNIYGANGGNQTVTDSSGNYTMKIRAGTGYTIEGFVPGKGPLTPITNVTITANATLANQDLSVEAPGTITVTITGITDAFVDSRDANGRGFGTGSNTSGVYSLTLPPGTYTVKAQNPKYGLLGSQTGVALAASGTASVTFTAPTLYTVSGTITSSTSVCKEGASIFLTDTTNGRFIVTSTDSAGAWSIDLPNGTYFLSSAKPGCVDSASPASITVSGANVSTGTGRSLTLSDATVAGRVTLSGSNATVPAKIVADNGSGIIVVTSLDTTATGTNNNYTLSLIAGTWTIRAYSDGYQSASISKTVVSGDNSTSGNDLTLAVISGYTIKESKSMTMKPAQGGIVKNSDIGTKFEVNIPAGALGNSSDDGSITTREKTSVVSTGNARIVGNKGYEISPKNASGQPIKDVSSSSGAGITVTIPYSESDIPTGISESQLVIGHWSEEKQQWESLPTVVDTTNNTLTANVTEFSDFAPIAPTSSQAPSTPTGLTATASGNQVTLTWNSVAGATSYDLYRDDNSFGNFPRVGSEPTTTNTTYTDTNLGSGVTYYYKVSALNINGESAVSSYVSVRTAGGAGSSPGGGGVSAPTPTPTALTEGSLVKSATDNNVYLIKGGKKLLIPSWQAFVNAGFKAAEIKTVPASDVAAAASVVLFKSPDDDKVYLIKGSKRFWIPSVSAFENAGYKWSDIVSLAKTQKDIYPEVNLIKTADSDKVYVIGKGLFRHIANPSVFDSYGYKWTEIMTVSFSEMNMYGQANLIRGVGQSKVYLLENGQKQWITSAAKFNTLGYDWNKILEVNSTELNVYPTGKEIK